jgi:hypothetical protein
VRHPGILEKHVLSIIAFSVAAGLQCSSTTAEKNTKLTFVPKFLIFSDFSWPPKIRVFLGSKYLQFYFIYSFSYIHDQIHDIYFREIYKGIRSPSKNCLSLYHIVITVAHFCHNVLSFAQWIDRKYDIVEKDTDGGPTYHTVDPYVGVTGQWNFTVPIEFILLATKMN